MLVATPNADDRGHDTMLAIAGAKLSSLVLEPHLFVTYFGGGDSDENRHGSGAKHAMSMVGVLLESGKFVSATGNYDLNPDLVSAGCPPVYH